MLTTQVLESVIQKCVGLMNDDQISLLEKEISQNRNTEKGEIQYWMLRSMIAEARKGTTKTEATQLPLSRFPAPPFLMNNTVISKSWPPPPLPQGPENIKVTSRMGISTTPISTVKKKTIRELFDEAWQKYTRLTKDQFAFYPFQNDGQPILETKDDQGNLQRVLVAATGAYFEKGTRWYVGCTINGTSVRNNDFRIALDDDNKPLEFNTKLNGHHYILRGIKVNNGDIVRYYCSNYDKRTNTKGGNDPSKDEEFEVTGSSLMVSSDEL